MQLGMAHVLRPPEGALSKQVLHQNYLPLWLPAWLWNNTRWGWENLILPKFFPKFPAA